jgi:hypothetical protein
VGGVCGRSVWEECVEECVEEAYIYRPGLGRRTIYRSDSHVYDCARTHVPCYRRDGGDQRPPCSGRESIDRAHLNDSM